MSINIFKQCFFKGDLTSNHIIHGPNISNNCGKETQSNNITTKDVRNLCKYTEIVLPIASIMLQSDD